MDMLEVIGRHPFDADAAERRLPGVHVGVHQARHHDLVGGINGLVGGGVEVAAYSLDGVAGDEQLAALHLADRRIERNEPAAFDERGFHGCRFLDAPPRGVRPATLRGCRYRQQLGFSTRRACWEYRPRACFTAS
jgi:hypothetical protein